MTAGFCKVKMGNGRVVTMSHIEKSFWDAAKDVIPGLIPQFEIGRYRVDFFVLHKGCVIELDGHDYHKTKEQRTYDAERERFIEKQGYQVVRFTGSEIYKDVGIAVRDVLQIIETPLLDSSKKDSQFICYSFQREIEHIALKMGMDIYGCGFYVQLHLGDDLYDPLSIEMSDNGDVISISHTFEANRDVAFDPKIEFHIIKDKGAVLWLPYTYTNSMLGVYDLLSKRVDNIVVVENGLKLTDVVNYVESHWARNLRINEWGDNATPMEKKPLQAKLFND